MVALKGRDIDAYLKSPDAARPVVLLYGPDWGLVKERATALEAHILKDNDDPFARVVLTSDDIASDSKRLADESNTISMFGGKRCITVNVSGTRTITSALDPVLSTPPDDAFIIFCAGDLKPSSPLRKRIESSKSAVSVACFMDQAQGLNQLIDEEAKLAGITVQPEARALLLQTLGGDRLATRNELKKLMLYSNGFESVTVDHVYEICADVSGSDQASDIIDKAFLGDRDAQDYAYNRFLGQGLQSPVLLSALQRHIFLLLEMHAAAATGNGLDQAIDRARPPIFFKRKPLIRKQCDRWPEKRLRIMLEHSRNALMQSRKESRTSDLITARLLTVISMSAR